MREFLFCLGYGDWAKFGEVFDEIAPDLSGGPLKFGLGRRFDACFFAGED